MKKAKKDDENKNHTGRKTGNNEVNVLFEELKAKLDIRLKNIRKEVDNLKEMGLNVKKVFKYKSSNDFI